jgi:monothiol glutaredoxin
MIYQDANDVQKVISETVANYPIVLFVKGTPEAPQCGFSKGVMDIFGYMDVPFKTVNVLADPLIREGIKQFTQWPTIPQIFIKGEFVGGFDIVRDLFERGELEPMVKAVSGK